MKLDFFVGVLVPGRLEEIWDRVWRNGEGFPFLPERTDSLQGGLPYVNRT